MPSSISASRSSTKHSPTAAAESALPTHPISAGNDATLRILDRRSRWCDVRRRASVAGPVRRANAKRQFRWSVQAQPTVILWGGFADGGVSDHRRATIQTGAVVSGDEHRLVKRRSRRRALACTERRSKVTHNAGSVALICAGISARSGSASRPFRHDAATTRGVVRSARTGCRTMLSAESGRLRPHRE